MGAGGWVAPSEAGPPVGDMMELAEVGDWGLWGVRELAGESAASPGPGIPQGLRRERERNGG